MSLTLSPLLRRLGVRLPIIQAPMAGTSTPSLAAAVSNYGGLGSISVGTVAPQAAEQAILETKRLTQSAFNVNLFVHTSPRPDPERARKWIEHLTPTFREYGVDPPSDLKEIYRTFKDHPEMTAVLVKHRPAVVSFHFGLPSRSTIEQLKEAGITLFLSVTSLAEVRQAERAGIDVVIAQGIEAGGHRGIFDPSGPDDALTTFALTRLLVQKCSLPVISAGGIMDGNGIRAILDLGAIAAQLGTAFVVTNESAADNEYRTAFKTEAAEHTVLTKAISGRPARSLANKFTKLPLDLAKAPIPEYPFTYDAGKALNTAAKARGEGGFASQWAGQGAPLARPMPAAELMAVLEKELGEIV